MSGTRTTGPPIRTIPAMASNSRNTTRTACWNPSTTAGRCLRGACCSCSANCSATASSPRGHLYFPGSVAEHLRLRTQRGNRSSYVKPDLMVFPPAYELPADAPPGPQRLCPARARRRAPVGAGGRNPVGLLRGAGLRGQAAAVRGPRRARVLDMRRGRHPPSGLARGTAGVPVDGRSNLCGSSAVMDGHGSGRHADVLE